MEIRHDFHIHTDLSLCAKKTAKLDKYVEISKKLGLKKIGIANHFWDSKIDCRFKFYGPQNFEHISSLKSEIEKANSDELKIYFGAETEYDLLRRDVAVTEEAAEQLDFLLVPNSHTHLTMPKELYEPYEKHMEFMIRAYEDILNSNVSKYITAMAHPFEAVCCPYDNELLIDMISDDIFKKLFDKTAEKGIAFEINVASMNQKSHLEIENCAQIRMFRLAKECGCEFIFGSDAHDDTEHNVYDNATFTANLLELKDDDIAEIAR